MLIVKIKAKRSALLVFLFVVIINGIFCYKYSSRFVSFPIIVTLFYSCFLVFIYLYKPAKWLNWAYNNFSFYSILFIFTIFQIILLLHIPVASLKVDRWSTIYSFWEEAFKGNYPYNAYSHLRNHPGPLPFYFIISLPFYLLNEVGYLSLIGIIIFAYFLRKNLSKTDSTHALLIFLLSTALLWEVIVRSTIIVNALIFLFYLHWISSASFNFKKCFWISSILAGLILSTRTIFIIPLAMYAAFLYRSGTPGLRQILGWAGIAFLSFLATFSPFLIFNFQEFLVRNPFLIQTEFIMPIELSIGLVILSIILGYKITSKNEIISNTMWIFLLVFLLYVGFRLSYPGRRIDLSYSLFAFPLLLYFSFKQEKV